jgi:hypothetical protein
MFVLCLARLVASDWTISWIERLDSVLHEVSIN